jgi:hypothetical protein
VIFRPTVAEKSLVKALANRYLQITADFRRNSPRRRAASSDVTAGKK